MKISFLLCKNSFISESIISTSKNARNPCKTKKSPQSQRLWAFPYLVHEAGLEPARPEWTLEPESSESANSTTRAYMVRFLNRSNILARRWVLVNLFFSLLGKDFSRHNRKEAGMTRFFLCKHFLLQFLKTIHKEVCPKLSQHFPAPIAPSYTASDKT